MTKPERVEVMKNDKVEIARFVRSVSRAKKTLSNLPYAELPDEH